MLARSREGVVVLGERVSRLIIGSARFSREERAEGTAEKPPRPRRSRMKRKHSRLQVPHVGGERVKMCFRFSSSSPPLRSQPPHFSLSLSHRLSVPLLEGPLPPHPMRWCVCVRACVARSGAAYLFLPSCGFLANPLLPGFLPRTARPLFFFPFFSR